MSRAQWLAFGSLALAGCNAHVQATNDGATTKVLDASASPITTVDANTFDVEASIDASGADVTVDDAADEGQWTADSFADDVSTNAASDQDATLGAAVDGRPDGCVPMAGFRCNSCTQYYLFSGVSECRNFAEAGFGDANCAASPTCACVPSGGPCSCSEGDAGQVTVTCYPCYGAPPARLERLARAA